METCLNSWKEEFQDKKVLIWGCGREGLSSYRFIRKVCKDLHLYISDGNTSKENLERIDGLFDNYEFVKEEDIDESFDLILKSPGIVPNEKQRRLDLSSQAQLFLKHYRNQTVGVTGTKGKSTTASLIAKALSTTYPTHLVGNIGIPCFEAIEQMEQGDLAVFEISCHQLEFTTVSPHIGVFLNLFEEHLDHYGSFQAYGDAKANIFRHMNEDDVIIIHKDLNSYVHEIKHPILIGEDIYAKDHHLYIPNHSIEVKSPLIGAHNYTNMAVAYEIAKLYKVSDENFKKAMEEFTPLAHRLSNLGEFDGVTYVDDSISTIGQSCISAIESLPTTKTVLVGGMDRGIEYHELEDYLMRRKDINVIFMYASGHRVYDELRASNRLREGMFLVENLEEATHLAKKITPRGGLVLLSPAASSYDHFKNFEERGDVFRKLVSTC